MDHRHHHPLGGPPGPPTSLPPRAPQGHHDDRDRSISSGPPKRSRMDTRTPPNGDIYSHSHLQQQQHMHAGIPRQYKEVSRSPEMERMNGPGVYRNAPPPPPPPPPPGHPSHSSQQQRHESVPQSNAIHPVSRSSTFMPPPRTSTPETHQRVSSVHSSPRIFRAPPPPPPLPPQESMMQQSLQQQHVQQQHHRGMLPPNSPHHVLAPPPQQPQQRPPPPNHHHPPGPPPFVQAPSDGPRRDLPSLSSISNSRPSMSISSMLGSSDPPAPPSHAPHPHPHPHPHSHPHPHPHPHPSPINTHSLPPSSSRTSDFSPLKRPYTPDLNGVPGNDRDKQVNSSSASPSTGNAPLPSFAGPKSNRATPHEHVYRAHQQLQYHSLGHNRDREQQQIDIMGSQGPPPPQRQMSQPVTNSQSISSVLHDEPPPPQRPQLTSSDSYQERMRKYDWQQMEERQREEEMRLREHREREQREREHRERERDREHRDREAKENRDRARIRERTERVPIGQQQQMFGREHRHEHQHQHQPPQTSSSHLSYPMTPTSRMMAGQDAIPGPPPVSAISTSSTMAMPQTSTSGTGGLGATPAPLPTATTTGREGFQPFTAYTTPMPPSPFAITNLPVLPPVVEGGRDSRRQGFPVGGPSFGRDEPARAEDALRGGLSRQSSGLAADEDRRRREKDRDNLMRERDGPQRMNGPSLGDQAQQKRVGMGIQNMEIVSMTQKWSEDFQKGLMENNREREREEAGKISLGLGKRERERDEEEAAKEKKKKHHHHHNHNHHSHVQNISAGMVHHHHKAEEEVGAPNLEVPVSRAGARSKSPNSLAHMHHPHMHHPHHNTPIIHHHHNASASASAAAPQPKVKTSLLIDSTKVTASLSKPRNFLGSVIYHPTATPKQGYSVTHTLLPRFEGKENSIFQVRIPRRYLSEQQRKEVHRRRCVWGTEVYTDDSDVMAALIHLGKIPGVMPPDVDPAWVAEYGARKITTNGQTSASPRSPLVPSPTKKKVNGAGGKAEKQQVQDIPVIPAGKDLIVNLLILPTLERYTGSTCNGLKSRSWGTIHDGMSYSVWDIEWVEAGEAEARGGGSKKRRLDERDFVRRWGELPLSRGGMGNNGWSKNRWTVSGDGRGGGSKGKVAEVGA